MTKPKLLATYGLLSQRSLIRTLSKAEVFSVLSRRMRDKTLGDTTFETARIRMNDLFDTVS